MSFPGLVDRSALPRPEIVQTSIDGHVGLIELNEPERLNPLGLNEMHIHYALLEMHADENVRVVIITGRGRAFSAGADFSHADPDHDLLHRPPAQRLAHTYSFGNLWETLHRFRKPLIAAVNGYCLGGGWELAHMCDFVLASDNAIFGAVEINVGLPPFATTCNYLAKMIGKHRAMDMVINARKITASEAFDLGLLNKVVPLGSLMDEARALAAEIASRPPITVAACKQLVVKAMDTMEDYELERALAYFVMPLEDTRACWEAAAAKQPRPEFKGC